MTITEENNKKGPSKIKEASKKTNIDNAESNKSNIDSAKYDWVKSPKRVSPSSSSQVSNQGSKQKLVRNPSPVSKRVPSSPNKSQNKRQIQSPSPT